MALQARGANLFHPFACLLVKCQNVHTFKTIIAGILINNVIALAFYITSNFKNLYSELHL